MKSRVTSSLDPVIGTWTRDILRIHFIFFSLFRVFTNQKPNYPNTIT